MGEDKIVFTMMALIFLKSINCELIYMDQNVEAKVK